MAVNPIPEGYHTATPYLTVEDGEAAIDFYRRAFGATERMRMGMPDGKLAHAELQIGDSIIMLSDPFPQASTRPPTELGGTTGGVFLYVPDVDASFRQAVDAGATAESEPQDMFWGDRFGSLKDPFGHTWSLATHKEDLTEQEIGERAQAAMAQMAS